MFLGNILSGVFWKLQADRSKNPLIIAHTFRAIIRSDRWFTIPGSVVIVLAGVAAAIVGRIPILGTGWILWSLVLFTISGLAFMFRVAPLQTQLAALAGAAAESGQLNWSAYHSMARRWEIWGAVALMTPLAAMALMVLKPSLPSL
jgi:uncharacterized membrane protein